MGDPTTPSADEATVEPRADAHAAGGEPETDSEPSVGGEPVASAPSIPGRWILLTASVVAVLVLDQLTKTWAVRRLAPPPLGDGDVMELVGSLRFRYAENTGMAFSRGSGSGPWIALVAVIISVVLVWFAAKAHTRLQIILMGVVMGGALGNVLDRAFRGNSMGLGEDGFMSGAVVDFVDLQWWPVFNVADAAIVCGGIALVIFGMREPKADEPPVSAEPETT